MSQKQARVLTPRLSAQVCYAQVFDHITTSKIESHGQRNEPCGGGTITLAFRSEHEYGTSLYRIRFWQKAKTPEIYEWDILKEVHSSLYCGKGLDQWSWDTDDSFVWERKDGHPIGCFHGHSIIITYDLLANWYLCYSMLTRQRFFSSLGHVHERSQVLGLRSKAMSSKEWLYLLISRLE